MLTAIAVAAGAAAADGRAGAVVAVLAWVIQEGLARSFAGHPALRPFYLFATSRPGPDPAGYWPNRLSLLLVAAVAAVAGWLLLGSRRGCCKAVSARVHPVLASSMAVAEMPALLGTATCEYRMLIRTWWLWAAIAAAGITGTRLAGIPLSTQLIWPARAEVGVYAVNFNLLVPLIAGLALAGRATRERRLGLAELLESTGSRRGARLWGRFLGAAAAVSTQALVSWLVVLLVIAVQRRSGLPLAWGLAAFAAVVAPGLIFVTALSLAGAAVLTPAVYRVLLAGYWFWGNLMPPRLMPTLAATPLLPLGSYAADGLFARDLPGGLAGLSYLLRDARSAAQAGASIGLLLAVALAAVAALQLTEARRARAG